MVLKTPEENDIEEVNKALEIQEKTSEQK
ncbi:hypothetical protein CCAN2_1830023 [Capnocytophaga canimorsus]|nr:hypothetical protein CCAN2_1830023 [Capnocytophaga canimorsus]